jgi:hypothetical protein
MELGKTSGRTTPVWIGLNYAESVPFSQLVRYTLSKDPGSTGSKWSVAKRDLSSTQLDFPSLNPRVVGKKVCFGVYQSAPVIIIHDPLVIIIQDTPVIITHDTPAIIITTFLESLRVRISRIGSQTEQSSTR